MKITYTHKNTYAEEGQPNPIRWLILSGTPETGFKNESEWLKCKDFFNDYAVAYQGGKRFNIYGFDTSNMHIPKTGEPVYIAVKETTEYFDVNMGVVNQWLSDRGLPRISCHKGTNDADYVLEFPEYFFRNTYNISLISLIIRLCNIEYFFKDFEEMKVYQTFPQKDQQKWNQVVAKDVFFNIPKKLQEYIWYCGKQHNSKNPPADYALSSLVHNCGVLTWQSYF
jgi:hypothetical protein